MERRKHARHILSCAIEIKEAGSSFALRGATTDVSLSGCYVATIFPLAVGSQIHFVMQVAGESIKGRGSVQTCHPGVGMGIQFIDLSHRDKARLDGYFRASAPTQPESVEEYYFR